jgi:glycerophosphoryl diester phosphodiesterase
MLEIFAHRGLLDEYPENSIPALEAAFQGGFGVETDLRLTRDNDFLLIHDDIFLRLAGIRRRVEDTTLAEAEAIKYQHSNEHLTSFRAFLEMAEKENRGRQMAIHFKADSQNEKGFRLLARYWQEFNLYDTAFAFDLTKEAASRLKEIDSKIKIALIVSDFKFEPTIYLWEEVRDFKPMDIVWSAEYLKLYSKAFLNRAKGTGRIVYAMSPDVHWILGHPLAYSGYEQTWDNLAAWGFEGICTDYPEKLKKRLEA